MKTLLAQLRRGKLTGDRREYLRYPGRHLTISYGVRFDDDPDTVVYIREPEKELIVICDRCGVETNSFIMSMFNTENICIACKKAEVEDPRYKEAARAEMEAVRQGMTNFKGIGR